MNIPLFHISISYPEMTREESEKIKTKQHVSWKLTQPECEMNEVENLTVRVLVIHRNRIEGKILQIEDPQLTSYDFYSLTFRGWKVFFK